MYFPRIEKLNFFSKLRIIKKLTNQIPIIPLIFFSIVYRVDFDLNVRICDSALSRDIFPNEYHCLGDNEIRPIKWMALESLEKKFYTTSSDIWGLGVLLWELSTLALMPFEEVDSFELAAYLRDGYRLAQPVNCPDEL